MSNLEIYEKVRSVPETAKKEIRGGRLKGKTDINPMWRIKVLTERFGPCGIGWYYETTKQWTEPCGDEVAAFVNISLFIKYNGEWSKPIFGVGGSMFAEKEREGIHVSDECFKMATTDAISVACKQLGIGADVYWEKDKTKYDTSEKEASDADIKRLEPVFNQLKRTGYSQKAVCNKYNIDNIFKMSNLQIKDFLEKIKSLPDKAVS